MRSVMISALAVAAIAAPSTPLIDGLVADMRTLDFAVLGFGGQNPRPIMEAYKKLQTNINMIVASMPVTATNSSSHQVANTNGAVATQSRAETPLAVAGEDLLRDIKSGKWAFQLAGICSKAFEATTSLGASYERLFVALSTQAPVESQAGVVAVGARVNQAFIATASVLAPTNCIDGISPTVDRHNAMAPKPSQSQNATRVGELKPHGTGAVTPSKNATDSSATKGSAESNAAKSPTVAAAPAKNDAVGMATFSVGGIIALIAAMIL